MQRVKVRSKTLKKKKEKGMKETKRQADRCDDCEIWEMAATGTRVVTQNHIPFFQLVPLRSDLFREEEKQHIYYHSDLVSATAT